MPPSSEVVQAPVHGFRGDTPAAPLARPLGLTVAVSREAGARGAEVARRVADILGWQVFDHDTLDFLVQNDTARAQLLADVPAEARAWAAAQLDHLRRDHHLNADPDALPLIQLVLTVAARGNAVVVGRAAGFLLPPETTLHVRVVSPADARVAYLAQELRLTRPEAAEEVRARDARRAAFLDQTLGRDPSDPTSYDLVVNSERLGVEGAAQFIGWAVRTKQQFAEIAERSGPAARDFDELAGA